MYMSQVYPITDADLYHVLLHILRLSLLQAQVTCWVLRTSMHYMLSYLPDDINKSKTRTVRLKCDGSGCIRYYEKKRCMPIVTHIQKMMRNHSNLIGIVPQSCLPIYSEAGKTLRITSDKVVELLHFCPFLKRCKACTQDS